MQKKRGGRLGGNPKRKDPKRRPLPETLKERKKKEKKGGDEPYTSCRPPQPLFLAQSPSTSPLTAAHIGKFPSFIAKIINWLLLHACVNLSRMAGLDPAQKEKKRVGRVWALGLADPNCVC
jgi:hypothetical protein